MVKVVLNEFGRQCLVRTEMDVSKCSSFLKVVERTDKLPVDYDGYDNFKDKVYYMVTHDGAEKLGFVLRFAIDEMVRVNSDLFQELFTIDEIEHEIRFKSHDFEERNRLLDELALELYHKSTLKEIKGWRDEKYPVYVDKNLYILVERSMAGALGIVTYGIHINGYTVEKSTNEIKFWIPRRSKSKQTWPNMLDNIIAGGLAYPYGVHETVLKESMEEANLSKSIVEKYITPVGLVSYLHYSNDIRTDTFDEEKSFVVGEVEHLFDMKLPEDVIPRPNDGEVESFQLMSLQEVIYALFNDEFKPNSGLIMLEFLIRHGFVHAENEPNYNEIITKMHRKLPFPVRN
ncbi:hypothetical protein Kpol_1000p19 [Vanderwaltozyma polyspora DSM 70294]|uniref:Nudix hydrolase domain-containing protein n=1 Tax=Vanderwaltozyma polyspora (strain ATCC 22028 / DSM 70294 / BCRC 21397 / CBS 2163 / NBRC 10782 / NRRL Y-8283 / UCD 57-17) TaxID=436907 RepID=A7TPV9_VANPO|nr:uncharacterized protein Kpol_1000p19 [Vanderwaltozyma polyspora DSM 70294]EDO15707.1 hypothetical protein Kpol_1000p19 [Vanderwaltozyma polyspora DSM 70294]